MEQGEQPWRLFDKHQIAFVSVIQQFNTASSMGRLVLNVLIYFAQFERKQRGMWEW